MNNEDKIFALLEKICTDLQDTKEEVQSIRKDLQDTKEEVQNIRKDLQDTKEEVQNIRKDLHDTKIELAKFKEETNERFNSLQAGQNSIEKKLDAVFDQTAHLTEFKTETKQALSDIKDTLRFILHKEIETEKEIFRLKEKTSQIK